MAMLAILEPSLRMQLHASSLTEQAIFHEVSLCRGGHADQSPPQFHPPHRLDAAPTHGSYRHGEWRAIN